MVRQNEYIQYCNMLEKYFNHTLKSHESIKIGVTPNALQIGGAPGVDLYINQNIIKKCIEKHQLTKNIFMDMYAQLQDPIMIFKGNDGNFQDRRSIVIVTALKDQNDDMLICAIQLHRKKDQTKVNNIRSIYGKKNIHNYIRKQISQRNLIAYNIQKTDKSFQLIGL